jgi:hypothetical protein
MARTSTRKKAAAPIDTSAGTTAYKLATLHQADVEPRVPAGMIPGLAADLTLLGANPNPPATPPPAPGPAPAAPPTLAQAMASAVAITSAIHDAIHGAKATSAVRKAYGVTSRVATKEPKAVIAEGEKMLAQAQKDPTQALSLGILPADTAALAATLGDLTAADTAAKAKGAGAAGGVTAKEMRAAETRMHEAVARIAGAGVLAFARNPAVRAEFEAIKPKKKA